MSEDYLTYYGVLGMKWGVRRHHSAPLNRYKKTPTERGNRMERKI
jgi:hypothetical protein